MITLLKKEFKLNPFFIKPNKKNWLSFLLAIILIVGLVVIETFLFNSLYDKFDAYEGASFSFSILFLIIVALISLIISIFYVQRIFFNRLDMSLTINKPIDYMKIIISKLIYCLIINYVFAAVINFPILYSIVPKVAMQTLLGFATIFYPLFLSLLNIGISLIISIPIQYIYRLLKQYPIVQLIIVALGLSFACYLYSLVLNLFVDLMNNNSMQILFSSENLALINDLAHNFYPYSYLCVSYLNFSHGVDFIIYLVISLIALAIGVSLIALFYVKVNQFEFVKEHNNKYQYHILKSDRAIIKKEFLLLFKENDTTYSFTSLIILQPVLTFLVINAINVALLRGNLAIYITIMPYLLNNFDLLMALLFSSVISLNAVNIYKSELKTIRVMKYIPYSMYKHVYIKLLIPFICSLFATIITFIVLVSTSLIGLDTFFMGLLLSIIIIFSLMVLSLKEQLRSSKFEKANSYLSNFLSFFIPLIICGINILLASLLGWLNIYTYLFDLIIVFILLGYVIYYLIRKFKNDVLGLEVVN